MAKTLKIPLFPALAGVSDTRLEHLAPQPGFLLAPLFSSPTVPHYKNCSLYFTAATTASYVSNAPRPWSAASAANGL